MATKEKKRSPIRLWFLPALFLLAAFPAFASLPRLAESRVWLPRDFAPHSVPGNRAFTPETQGVWEDFSCGQALNPSIDPDGRCGKQWLANAQAYEGNVNSVGDFFAAVGYGVGGTLLSIPGAISSTFSQASQGMAQANQQISGYTGGQAFLAQTLALPANFAFGTTALVNDPANTVPQIPGAIAQLPGNIANNVQNFASSPSINGGFALLNNGLQVGGLVEGGASLLEGANGLLASDTTIANPVPTTVARVIPNGINATTLGAPGAADVFVADASQLQGLNAQQIAAKLGIPESPTGFQVIQFPTPGSGLASPVFRSNPGFVGGGLTSGGASEFVIPNGPIPSGATTTIIH